MTLTTNERRRLGMAYQVKYDCGHRGGCGATETATHPAPFMCSHGGTKRDAPEVDAELDGRRLTSDEMIKAYNETNP